MSFLVVGTVAIDALETPFGKRDKIVGGSALYASYSAAHLGVGSKLVAVIGNDFPMDTIADLKNRGVATEGLQIKADEKSFFWAGRYHNDMNTRDTLTTDLNVLATFDPVVPDSYQGVDYVMLGNLSPQVQISVLNRLKKRPKLVLMDTMNFWMDNTWDDLVKAISMVDVLAINDEEARQLSGEYSLVKAARKITQMGPQFLIIKKGEHGALLFHKDQIFFAPALPLEVVFDPTGAGDTFAGGFIGYLAKTDDISFENMKRAIIYGSAMASFCVEKFGPERLQGLTKAEIETRLQRFISLSQFDITLT